MRHTDSQCGHLFGELIKSPMRPPPKKRKEECSQAIYARSQLAMQLSTFSKLPYISLQLKRF